MRKALLFFIFITALPIVSSAESFYILFPVATDLSITNVSGITDTSGFAIHYADSSGLGLGLTDVNLNSSVQDNSTIKINFRALELSYTLGYLTLGLGNLISGLYTKTVHSQLAPYSNIAFYSITGITGFATLALDIYDKGSLLIGYHMSSLTFKSSTASSESGSISNVMLGFRFPI